MVGNLEQIRQKAFQNEQSNSNNSTQSGPRDNILFRHWMIPFNDPAVIRLVEDGDKTNLVYWRDYSVRDITFTSVKGMDVGDTLVKVRVPAFTYIESKQGKFNALEVPESYHFSNKEDPVQMYMSEENLYETNRDLYYKFKRKISHLYQGFIRKSPGLVDNNGKTVEDTCSRLLRRFIMSEQIHTRLNTILRKTDKIKHLVTDPVHGREFEILKEKGDGGYASYNNSEWDYTQESPLTEQEALDIETNGLYDLKDFIPSKPTTEQLQVIFEMFEASVAGLPYEPDKWAEHYKPSNVLLSDTNTTTVSVSKPTTESVDENDDEAPFDTDDAPKTASSVLDRIKRGGQSQTTESPSDSEDNVQTETKNSATSANRVIEMLRAKKAQQNPDNQ